MATEPTNTSGSPGIVVGSARNFWVWSHDGWDLSHPPTPQSARPENLIHLDCEVSNVMVDPVKTALVIIDMQNIALNRALEPPTSPAMYRAQETILRYAIPAARKLRFQIIWLNWGLTEDDLANIPPAEVRIFGFKANSEKADYGLAERRGDATNPENFIKCGEQPNFIKSPGTDLGDVILQDGTRINAGRSMMKGAWNTALHGPLAAAYEKGKHHESPRPDVWIDKNRNSGLWNQTSPCSEYLRKEGIRTLLFAGINTDQCVGATLQDAHAQGFDTIMLKDGCATDSPEFAQASYEFNSIRSWGFLTSCRALAKAADIEYGKDSQ